MLISVHSQLRRQRRRALLSLAVLAAALTAVTAHSAVMNDMGDHAMSDAAALCLVVGGSLVAVGVTILAIGGGPRRPLWVILVRPALALPFLPASADFSARAGPQVLQVFRL